MKTGFHEMEKKEDNWKKYPTYKQNSRNYFTSKRNNSRNYHYKHLGSFRNLDFNRSRDRYNPSRVQLRHSKLQNSTSQCPKEAAPWSEEALELERKQQLSDAANKLMNKLKIWSTEKNVSKECDESTNRVLSEEKESNQTGKGRNKEDKQSSEQLKNQKSTEKRKKTRINHENVRKVISSRKPQFTNSFNQSPNQASVNKQKKIQQNIIGELMTMPKENLNKVLVNPKIHPKIEKKMAQIVKENRLILAQKFRHLAESKINCQGLSQFQSKFIVDVENLIDPDLAIDLCQLPPELIKQMGDIFQLDFDNGLKNSDLQEDNDSSNATCEDNTMNCIDTLLNSSVTFSENRNDFERLEGEVGSQSKNTIEKVEIQEKRAGKISVRNFANCFNENQVKIEPLVSECHQYENKSKKSFPTFNEHAESGSTQNTEKQCNNFFDSHSISNLCTTINPVSYSLVQDFSIPPPLDDHSNISEAPAAEMIVKQEQSTDSIEFHQNVEPATEERPSDADRISDCLRIDKKSETKSSEVQTDINLMELDYSAGFQKNLPENMDRSSLLQEVAMIDNLTHILNQRRFLLFLKLVNLDTCKSKNNLRNKLMKAITNSDGKVLKNKKKRKKRDGNKPDTSQSCNGREKQGKLPKNGASNVKTLRQEIKEGTQPDIMIIEPVTKTTDVKMECV